MRWENVFVAEKSFKIKYGIIGWQLDYAFSHQMLVASMFIPCVGTVMGVIYGLKTPNWWGIF